MHGFQHLVTQAERRDNFVVHGLLPLEDAIAVSPLLWRKKRMDSISGNLGYVYKESVGRCPPHGAWGVGATAGDGIYAGLRQRMVDDIASDVQSTRARLSTPGLETRVLTLMRTVPRHEFVPPQL